MTDSLTPEQRHRNMSHVRSKNTKPELVVRSMLHKNGFRFRLHDKRFAGKPDIVLPKYKTVVFVHGCFWHGHKCKKAKLPQTNREFWASKIENNIKRFEDVKENLEQNGWNVYIIWECELKNLEIVENQLISFLKNLKGKEGNL